jgi:hypothetical protein
MNGAEIARTRIMAIAAVAALVSARVYCVMLPQGNRLSAVRVSLVPGAPEALHLRGRTSVIVDRVQVDAYAALDASDPLGDAREIAAAIYGDVTGGVATGLIGWSGSIGSPGVTVDLIESASRPIEMFVPEEMRQWVVSQDYYVHYRA